MARGITIREAVAESARRRGVAMDKPGFIGMRADHVVRRISYKILPAGRLTMMARAAASGNSHGSFSPGGRLKISSIYRGLTGITH